MYSSTTVGWEFSTKYLVLEYCRRALEENTANPADQRSEIWNFTGKIFEISREYTGATRPLPLLTHTNAFGTAFPPVDLWSVDFAEI